MNTETRIIIILPEIDSLSAFSKQIYNELKKRISYVLLMDVRTTTLKQLTDFSKNGVLIVLSFNCYGLMLKTTDGELLWNQLDAHCYSYLVDPPFYFSAAEHFPLHKLTMLCVDENHAAFIRDYWKQEINAYFIPLAGTISRAAFIPYKERTFDILFTGACNESDPLDTYTSQFSKEKKELWFYCYEQLLGPCKNETLETVLANGLDFLHITVNQDEFKKILTSFHDIDTLIRHKYREEIISSLLAAKLPVHVFGSNYSMLKENREMLIVHGNIPYEQTIEMTANAKIVLNVMPWFKAGIHDRVYTAMLNKSVCVTDTSTYMDTLFSKQDVLIPYSLDFISQLPGKIRTLLANPDFCELIGEHAYTFAKEHGTFSNWTDQFLKCIQKRK